MAVLAATDAKAKQQHLSCAVPNNHVLTSRGDQAISPSITKQHCRITKRKLQTSAWSQTRQITPAKTKQNKSVGVVSVCGAAHWCTTTAYE
jgi:hypothetical protein